MIDAGDRWVLRTIIEAAARSGRRAAYREIADYATRRPRGSMIALARHLRGLSLPDNNRTPDGKTGADSRI